jgi:hypothetical protein
MLAEGGLGGNGGGEAEGRKEGQPQRAQRTQRRKMPYVKARRRKKVGRR